MKSLYGDEQLLKLGRRDIVQFAAFDEHVGINLRSQLIKELPGQIATWRRMKGNRHHLMNE